MTTRTFSRPSGSAMTAVAASLAIVLAMSGCDQQQPDASTVSNQPAVQILELNPEDFAPPTMSLYRAASSDDIEQVRANIAHGANLNEFVADNTRGGFTALHAASRAGYTEIVQLLVAAGADVDIPANAAHRATPLIWASRAGRLDVVKILVEAGADVNITGGVDNDLTAMRVAVDRNFHDIVRYLADHGGRM